MQKTKKHITKKTQKKIRKYTLKIKKFMKGGENNFASSFNFLIHNTSTNDNVNNDNVNNVNVSNVNVSNVNVSNVNVSNVNVSNYTYNLNNIINNIKKVLNIINNIYEMFYEKLTKYKRSAKFDELLKNLKKKCSEVRTYEFHLTNCMDKYSKSMGDLNSPDMIQAIEKDVLNDMNIHKSIFNTYEINKTTFFEYIMFLYSLNTIRGDEDIYQDIIEDLDNKKKHINGLNIDEKYKTNLNTIYNYIYERPNAKFFFYVTFLFIYYKNRLEPNILESDVFPNTHMRHNLNTPKFYIVCINKLIKKEKNKTYIKLQIFYYLYIIKLFIDKILIWSNLYIQHKKKKAKNNNKYNTRTDKIKRLLEFIKNINIILEIKDINDNLKKQIDNLKEFIIDKINKITDSIDKEIN